MQAQPAQDVTAILWAWTVAELLEQVAQAVGHVVVKQELHSEAGAICLATSKSISPRWSS